MTKVVSLCLTCASSSSSARSSETIAVADMQSVAERLQRQCVLIHPVDEADVRDLATGQHQMIVGHRLRRLQLNAALCQINAEHPRAIVTRPPQHFPNRCHGVPGQQGGAHHLRQQRHVYRVVLFAQKRHFACIPLKNLQSPSRFGP